MKLRFVLFLCILGCMTTLVLDCMNLAGGTIETTNGYVAGFLVKADGCSPASNTLVRLIPENYDPVKDPPIPDSYLDTTTISGAYHFTVPAAGRYSIEALHQTQRIRLLITGINVHKDTVHVPTGILKLPGSIKIMLPTGIDTVSGYFYIPGTTLSVSLSDNNGFVLLDSVPAGVMPSVNYSATNISLRRVIRYDVQVSPGDTTVILMPDWKYAKRLYLNTTASGAGVSATVTNFPVLVRLSSSNFDFIRAKPDGGDLRFTKADNTPLPYEIESWDAVGGLAVVWVLLDTIRGSNNTQNILMYWGNDKAAAASNSAAVFDTGASGGFRAVWHLAGGCNDATANTHHGTNFGTTDVAGIIGQSRQFHGSDSIKIAGLLGKPAIVTLSAWVNSESAPTLGSEVVTLGDAVLIRTDDSGWGHGTNGSFYLDSASWTNDTDYCVVGHGPYIAQTGWRYVVFTVDTVNHVHSLYVDGLLVSSRTNNFTIDYSGLGSNTFLGKHGNGKTSHNFTGCMDEVRVCSTARSADWIKLCYMNQKAVDALIDFK